MEARPHDPFWDDEPKRQFAEFLVDWWAWTVGFAISRELQQFQIHLGPFCVNFNAFAREPTDTTKAASE